MNLTRDAPEFIVLKGPDNFQDLFCFYTIPILFRNFYFTSRYYLKSGLVVATALEHPFKTF